MIALRDAIRLRRLPLVTTALIAANVIVYLVAIGSGGSILGGPSAETLIHFGAIPYEFTHLSGHCDLAAAGFSHAILCTGAHGVIGSAFAQPATWQTAFTSMFVHAKLIELAGNVAVLALLGSTLENRLGAARFLAFYVLGGLAALALAIAASPGSSAPALGASGAIAALLGGYLVHHGRSGLPGLAPRRAFELPASILAAAWLIFDALAGALGLWGGPGGGVAYYAHIGGFAFGLLTVRAFTRGRPAAYRPARTA